MTNQDSNNRQGNSILKEPLLHFALVAAVLFGISSLLQPNQQKTLEINQREIDARLALTEISSGRELTPQEQLDVEKLHIEELILVNEAKARGLDNDSRIHTILSQKLRHVLSGDVIQPSSAELATFYSENSARYRSPATVSVDELVLDTREELRTEVTDALSRGQPSGEILTLELGSAAPLPRVSLTDLGNIFDENYASSVFSAAIGEWVGPYRSNRGQHWLQILEHSPERIPEFDEVVDLVRLDWVAVEEDRRLQIEVDALVNQYAVTVNDDTE